MEIWHDGALATVCGLPDCFSQRQREKVTAILDLIQIRKKWFMDGGNIMDNEVKYYG